MELLERDSGTKFDPQVIAALKRVLAKDPIWKDKRFWKQTLA